MGALNSLEKSLGDVYKSAPELPANGKKALVEWLPVINLVLGLFTLWSVYVLWHWAHLANGLINYANQLSAAYGGGKVVDDRLGVMVWVSLVVLAVQAVVMLLAYAPLKARKKQGWDLLFYATLLNLAYGVATAFTDYGGGHLISSLVGAAIAFYFLYQIRSSYTVKAKAAKS